MAERF